VEAMAARSAGSAGASLEWRGAVAWKL